VRETVLQRVLESCIATQLVYAYLNAVKGVSFIQLPVHDIFAYSFGYLMRGFVTDGRNPGAALLPDL
jgi:hypothetical protein